MLARGNTIAYFIHLYATKKLKFFEYDPCSKKTREFVKIRISTQLTVLNFV